MNPPIIFYSSSLELDEAFDHIAEVQIQHVWTLLDAFCILAVILLDTIFQRTAVLHSAVDTSSTAVLHSAADTSSADVVLATSVFIELVQAPVSASLLESGADSAISKNDETIELLLFVRVIVDDHTVVTLNLFPQIVELIIEVLVTDFTKVDSANVGSNGSSGFHNRYLLLNILFEYFISLYSLL